MLRRLLSTIAASALLSVAIAVAPGVAAAAAPCSGTVCVTTLSGSTALAQGATGTADWSIQIDSGQAELSFIAHQTSGLQAMAGSARFDGAALPASAMSITGHTVTIDLSSVNPVAAGSHQLMYRVRMAPAAVLDQSISASVSFDNTIGGPVTVSSPPAEGFALTKPDFSIEPIQASIDKITAGNPFYLDLRLHGTSSVPSQLRLTIPAGFSFVQATQGEFQQQAIPCTGGVTVKCSGINYGSFTDVTLTIRANAGDRPGTTGSLTASVQPVGVPDATPSDNTRSVAVTVGGTVALNVTVSSPYGETARPNNLESTLLPIGKPTVLTLSVTNQGPDAASDVSGRIVMETNTDDYFTLGFGPGITGQQSSPHHFAVATWRIGHISVGQTAVSTITVTPKRFGDRAFLSLYLNSTELNTLQCDSRACLSSGGIGIEVVGAASTGSGSGSSSASSGTGPELANTGAQTTTPLYTGLLAVLIGAAFVLVGRRRRA